MGGLNILQDELRNACLDILKDPALMIEFIEKTTWNVTKQFIAYSIPPDNATEDQYVNMGLSSYNLFEFSLFSRQQLKRMDRNTISLFTQLLSHVYIYSLVASLLLFCFLFNKTTTRQRKFFLLLLGFLILNAIICGALTEPADRYQGRLLLLFPIFTAYLLFDRLQQLYNMRIRS